MSDPANLVTVDDPSRKRHQCATPPYTRCKQNFSTYVEWHTCTYRVVRMSSVVAVTAFIFLLNGGTKQRLHIVAGSENAYTHAPTLKFTYILT